jgi:glycosyltransferase involved in cell wall biosynthesis
MLVKDHKQEIRACLESLKGIDFHLVIGDCGSTDGTIPYCLGRGAKVIRIYGNDLSTARNRLMSMAETPWQMCLEPWETILSGKEQLIGWLTKGGPLIIRCPVLRDEVVTKEVRIWQRSSGIRFRNPVFEYLPETDSVYSDLWIYSPKPPDNPRLDKALKAWQEAQPAAPEPLYYEACAALAEGKHDDFLRLATRYLFMEKDLNCMSAVMARYYLALVQCYIVKTSEQALSNAMFCLGAKPTMAEFWCLAGDVFFQSREHARAKEFYQSAIIIGKRRRQDDAWPMHISKYEAYPQQMTDRCNQIMAATKIYVPQ